MQFGSFGSVHCAIVIPFSSRYQSGKPLSALVGPTAATPPVPVPVTGMESGVLAALESSRSWVGCGRGQGAKRTQLQVPRPGTVAPVEQESARIT